MVQNASAKTTFFYELDLIALLRGSHSLSARRVGRMNSSRPKGPKLEVGFRRGPRLRVPFISILLYLIFYIYPFPLFTDNACLARVCIERRRTVLAHSILLRQQFLHTLPTNRDQKVYISVQSCEKRAKLLVLIFPAGANFLQSPQKKAKARELQAMF